MAPKPLRIPTPGGYEIHVLGHRRKPLRDFYHALLRLPWAATIGTISAGFLLANLIFALVYANIGGIGHAEPGSLRDAFFFSVQTMGTIGYGAMYPETPLANAVVVLESIVSLVLTAAATGLVFAKFSRPTARVVFTREAVISMMDGKPTLSLRVSNERGNQIVDAQFRAILTRTEKTAEGRTYYRMYDLELVRNHTISLSRSFTLFHSIDDASPLFGRSEQMLRDEGAELQMLVVGLDDTTMHTVQATHTYTADQILWNARHADVLREEEDGTLVLDLRKFHDVHRESA